MVIYGSLKVGLVVLVLDCRHCKLEREDEAGLVIMALHSLLDY